MEIVYSDLYEIIIAVITGAMSLLAGAGIRYIFARVKNDKLRGYGDLLTTYAEKAVKTVAQTTGDDLKRLASDGKLTINERQQLKQSAVDNLKAIAPDAALKFMARSKSDLDELLNSLVEAAVHDRNGDNS